MAYNIDSAQFVGTSTLTIGGADVRDLVRALANRRPECTFLDDFDADDLDDVTDYPIKAADLWHGEFSGHTYDDLIEKVLPRTSGAADIVFTWEGGDSHTGVRVRSGVVTRHKVVIALGDEESTRV